MEKLEKQIKEQVEETNKDQLIIEIIKEVGEKADLQKKKCFIIKKYTRRMIENIKEKRKEKLAVLAVIKEIYEEFGDSIYYDENIKIKMLDLDIKSAYDFYVMTLQFIVDEDRMKCLKELKKQVKEKLKEEGINF